MNEEPAPTGPPDVKQAPGAGVESWTSFRVGHGIGLVSPATLALLEPSNNLLAQELWALLDQSAGIDDLLEAMSSTGLRALGAFAMVQFEVGNVRVVVRGRAVAELTIGAEREVVTAEGVKTWNEAVFPSATRVALRFDDDSDGGSPFRIGSGLVPAVVLIRGDASISRVRDRDTASVDAFDPTAIFSTMALSTRVAAVPTSGSGAHKSADAPGLLRSTATAPLIEDVGLTVTFTDVADFDVDRTMSAGSFAERFKRHPAQPNEAQSMDAPYGQIPGPHLEAVDTPTVEAQPLTSAEDYDFDEIFGRTRARTVEGAAVQATNTDPVGADPPTVNVISPPPLVPSPNSEMFAPPEDPSTSLLGPSGLIQGIPGDAAQPATPPNLDPRTFALGDHDGHTMSKAKLEALRAGGTASLSVGAQPSMGGPSVQTVTCQSGHANPPHHATCRQCGARLTGEPTLIARPVLGVLRFTDGQKVRLERPLLIGRNPKLEGRLPSEMPQLLKLDVGQGLSRTHAIVRLEGWQVLLEDLNSANGTVVSFPGVAPRRLHAGEPALLEYGAEIDFGGEISATYAPE